MTIEETFEQLEKILTKMEDKNTSLEDAFASYEAGMKLVQDCNASLDQVEKKIEEIRVRTGQDDEAGNGNEFDF